MNPHKHVTFSNLRPMYYVTIPSQQQLTRTYLNVLSAVWAHYLFPPHRSPSFCFFLQKSKKKTTTKKTRWTQLSTKCSTNTVAWTQCMFYHFQRQKYQKAEKTVKCKPVFISRTWRSLYTRANGSGQLQVRQFTPSITMSVHVHLSQPLVISSHFPTL